MSLGPLINESSALFCIHLCLLINDRWNSLYVTESEYNLTILVDTQNFH